MTLSKYVVWSHTYGGGHDDYEAYDDKVSAFRYAYSIDFGDYGQVDHIEGPGDEDLMAEFEQWSTLYSRGESERLKKANDDWRAEPKRCMEIRKPKGSISRDVYSIGKSARSGYDYDAAFARDLAEAVEIFGSDRVKVIDPYPPKEE